KVKNAQVLSTEFPVLSTWIGNRSVAETNISSQVAELQPGQSSFIVNVEIPAVEISKLQNSRFGGRDTVAFAIWNDFANSSSLNLPVSEH
ncbi:hypothetical protein DF186_16665, partial [Enterococcus hirae]